MKPDSFLFDALQNSFDSYSRSQKLLARLVLSDYQKVAFLTIKDFAELSGISEATIVRFVKILGFDGYPDFQKEIRRIVRSDLKGDERFKIGYDIKGRQGKRISEIIEKEIDNFSHLQKTFDPQTIKAAARAIDQATDVYVVGTRASASLACHLSFGLSKLNIRTTRILRINSELFDLLDRPESGALLIVIGFPRYVNDLLDVLTFCKERKIKTIAVTDSPFSPLKGDINLYSPAESFSFMAFHCAPLVLINAVVIELSMLDKKKSLAVLNRFEILAESKKYFSTT